MKKEVVYCRSHLPSSHSPSLAPISRHSHVGKRQVLLRERWMLGFRAGKPLVQEVVARCDEFLQLGDLFAWGFSNEPCPEHIVTNPPLFSVGYQKSEFYRNILGIETNDRRLFVLGVVLLAHLPNGQYLKALLLFSICVISSQCNS